MAETARFRVEMFGRTYKVTAETHNKARALAARKFNDESRKGRTREYPISFLTSQSTCVKIDKKPLGRPREYLPILAEEKE